MGNRKIKISEKRLFKLYWVENKSSFKIARIYGCESQTIRNRIKEFKIKKKTKCQAHVRYPRYDFAGDRVEKAYLIGFRIGDLRVYKTKPYSETIIAQCHTTCNNQVVLFKKVFKKYGQVTVTNLKDRSFDINCYLNNTFNFLLPKEDKIEPWICRNKKCFTGFIAGYTDAEGNFIINQKKARFKIDSYDRLVLEGIHLWLLRNKINSKLRLIGKKGQLRPEGYVFNNDLWRLNVNEAHSLLRFIDIIRPFVKHRKRMKDMNFCAVNILKRKKLGTI